MSLRLSTCLAACGTCGLLLLAAEPAWAQYGYYRPSAPIYGRQGGKLVGGAQFLQSEGNVLIQQEQARIEREKANQAKLETKRQAFDEMMYEKANTPTYAEELAKTNLNTVQRILAQSSPAEIARGATLNALLPYLKSLGATGVQGPPIPLDPLVVSRLNVRSGTSPGPELLRNGGKVRWPIALRGPTQKKLDELLPKAVAQAAAGELELPLYKQLTSGVAQLQDQLSKNYRTDQIDGATYLQGKHFLEALDPAVQSLQRDDAAQYLNGSFAAHGSNVQELVDNMTADGLKFAPALPGQEAAYQAAHSAFVSYARAAQSAGGLSMANPAPGPRPKNY